ncbi:hypothetical protein [Microbacterium sp.]|uniref:hypothetical protein n=1 Tax=Microbacterium sp. TaxID=51671 RepID=UPI0039E2A764
MVTEFAPGDLVFIGPAAPLDTKVVWRVSRINQADEGRFYATLRSGMTGRVSIVPVERLTKFTPRVSEPAL